MKSAEERKAFYEENGYLVVEDLLSQAEVNELRREADALVEQAKELTKSNSRFGLEPKGTALRRINEPHELGGPWLALGKDPRLLDVIEGLLGPNIQLYYSMMMMKPAREGSAKEWHQDFASFPHARSEILACMVFLDDATIENGCLRVVPGSHKMGLLNHYKDGRFTGAILDQQKFDDPTKSSAVPTRAGRALIWHSLTLHASQPNRSDKPRRGIVFEYKNPEARLLSGSFRGHLEVRPVGLMVRGIDPSGQLLSAF